jgi:hypothetical protein
MRRLPPLAAALLLLLPATQLAAGGAPLAVAVPCYPEDRIDLCEIPVTVGGHPPGYVPQTVPARPVLRAEGTRFAILVTPNVVPYAHAVAEAAATASAYCGRQAGERIVARIVSRERYAPENLESWRFAGHCN